MDIFNATKSCKNAGKELYAWTRNKESKKFIKYIEDKVPDILQDL